MSFSSWQDIVLTIVTIVFSVSLAPQVYSGFKEKVGPIKYQTSIPTFIGCFIIAGVYLSLGLYISSIFSFSIGTLWFLLFIQRLIYSKR